MPFLNVVYGGTRAEIKTDGFERVSQLRRAIKAEYNNARAEIDPPQLQLYKSHPEERIATMADFRAIPNEFYVEGGPCLEIHTSLPSAPENSLVGQVLSVSINQNKLLKK